MSTHPHDFSHDPTHNLTRDEDQALEDEITRGTVHDRDYAAHRTDSETQPADVGPEKSALRTGTLVWGVIALLLALWSLSVTVLDWNLDPVLVMIGLAVVGGVALVAGGIAGAARSKSS
ncbi:hypothetical protein LG284_15815 [Citricoccus nitrophenolicus]|uniref:Uncharacterized protein n=1 Tax=Citricoccus muralis TaxID=169134 RepID=A0A3D9LBX1_9MICC|nr:hypothetical protein [Citricoccus muralis]REE03891.1 hypothetical protein C8E99_1712 [Citricoccus muralis]